MPKDTLHRLIQTLSVSEKGYYTKSKGDSHYTTLFDSMNKMDEYDRTILEKRLDKHKDLLKHIAKYKNDTYSDIIKVMRSYKQEKDRSIDVRLKVYLIDINFLIERGLYENAMKLVSDARKLATKYEKYEIMLEIIHHERGLIKRLYSKDFIEMTDVLIAEKNSMMFIVNDESRYNDILYFLYSVWQRLPSSDDKLRRKYLDKLMSDELVTDEERAISFISQYRFYQIHAVYNHLIGNTQKAHKYYKRVIDCWDDFPHQKSEHMLTYVNHIHNYLNVCVELNNHEAFEKVLHKAQREIKAKNPHEEAVIFERLQYPEFFYYLNRADFDKLDNFILDIKPKLQKYSGKMNTSTAHVFRITLNIALFVMGKYGEAFEGFDSVIRQKLRTRIDTQCCSWVLKLAIAYERQDDSFDNLYRSAQRFFNKISKKEIREVYSLCLEYLYKLNNVPSFEIKETCLKFKTALEELDDSDKHVVGLNEMLLWIEHIMTKKTMMEILKNQISNSVLKVKQATL